MFRDTYNPTVNELQKWAFEPNAYAPEQDWEWVLSKGMSNERLEACVELASDPACPTRQFFLRTLYVWVIVLAESRNFDIQRTWHDKLLDVCRGNHDPAVKRWRRRAKLVFQGVEPFDREKWWAPYHDEADGG